MQDHRITFRRPWNVTWWFLITSFFTEGGTFWSCHKSKVNTRSAYSQLCDEGGGWCFSARERMGIGLLTAYGKILCSLSCRWCGKILHMGIQNGVFCKNMQHIPYLFPFVKFMTVFFCNSFLMLHWMDSEWRFMMMLLMILLLPLLLIIIPTITNLYPSVKCQICSKYTRMY